MNVDSKSAHTIPELIFAGARQYAEHIVLEAPGESISYAALPERVLAITRGLMASGIQTGDRIGVWAPNSTDWVLIALAIHCAGGVLVPINTRMKGNEAADVLERSGSRIVFVVGEFLGVDYPAMLAACRPHTLEQMVVIGRPTAAGQTTLADLTVAGTAITPAAARERAESITAGDLSDLLFTSGTTGKPKGVMSSHGQTLQAFREFVRILGIQSTDRYLVVNPFFHSFGYKAGWLTCMLAGATIIPQTVFDAEDIFRRVEEERITVLPGPPTLYLSMLAHPRLASADLSSLRVAVTGASAIPPLLIERLRNELGFAVVTTAYGLTECGGLATICDPAAPAETIASTSGRAIPGTELRIADEQGAEVPVGATGEICLRGFHVMQGYFNDPAATAETITAEGWLRTGDVGHIDADGNLTITDRLKDMFIVGGFNCYPAEIEAGLFEHPAIAQVAVVGIADERMGEVGCACVVLRRGFELTEQQLIDWSRAQMANYKVPRRVAFYADSPKNASNKIDKVELRRRLS